MAHTGVLFVMGVDTAESTTLPMGDTEIYQVGGKVVVHTKTAAGLASVYLPIQILTVSVA